MSEDKPTTSSKLKGTVGKGLGLKSGKLKPGSKNLLPSKVNVGPLGGKGTATSASSVAGTSRKNTAVSTYAQRQPAQKEEQVNTMLHYDKYLQSVCQAILVKEYEQLMSLAGSDTLGRSCATVAEIGRDANRVNTDSKIIKLDAYLSILEKIKSSFSNLVDFAGEEALMEIQSVLVNKFDKLQVKGAFANSPLFEENELEQMLSLLHTGLYKGETAAWCSEFVKKMKNIHFSAEQAERNIAQLEEANKIILETCSLLACSAAKTALEEPEEQEKSNAEIMSDVLRAKQSDLTEPGIGEVTQMAQGHGRNEPSMILAKGPEIP